MVSLTDSGQFDCYCYIQVRLTDITTYGLVLVILPHTGQFDYCYYIWVNLIEIATYR